MEAARASALEWVILRPPMVYGPGARGNFRRLVQLVRAGAPLPLGAATAPRSFIGIDNLADAVVRAVEHPRAANQVLLIADAETTSTVGLVHLIAAGLGRRIWTPHVSAALLRTALGAMGATRDVQRLFDPLELNTSRIRALLEWTPPVSLAEGVRRAVAPSAGSLERRIDGHAIAVGQPVGLVGHADDRHQLAEHRIGHAGLARRRAWLAMQ